MQLSPGTRLNGIYEIDALIGRGVPEGSNPDWTRIPNGGLQAYGGAIGEIGNDEAAFSHRGTLVEWGGSASWFDPAEDEQRIDAARAYGAAIEPGGAMYEGSQKFLAWAAGYDEGLDVPERCRRLHDEWLAGLPCPVVRFQYMRAVGGRSVALSFTVVTSGASSALIITSRDTIAWRNESAVVAITARASRSRT